MVKKTKRPGRSLIQDVILSLIVMVCVICVGLISTVVSVFSMPIIIWPTKNFLLFSFALYFGAGIFFVAQLHGLLHDASYATVFRTSQGAKGKLLDLLFWPHRYFSFVRSQANHPADATWDVFEQDDYLGSITDSAYSTLRYKLLTTPRFYREQVAQIFGYIVRVFGCAIYIFPAALVLLVVGQFFYDYEVFTGTAKFILMYLQGDKHASFMQQLIRADLKLLWFIVVTFAPLAVLGESLFSNGLNRIVFVREHGRLVRRLLGLGGCEPVDVFLRRDADTSVVVVAQENASL